MSAPRTTVRLLLKIIIVLLICSGFFVFFQTWQLKETDEKILQEQTIHTLVYEFKEGSPSINFIVRAKQLGATEVGFGSPGSHAPWASCNNSDDLNKLNTEYKSQLDGWAGASFIGPRYPYSFIIEFKDGIVTRATANTLRCGMP